MRQWSASTARAARPMAACCCTAPGLSAHPGDGVDRCGAGGGCGADAPGCRAGGAGTARAACGTEGRGAAAAEGSESTARTAFVRARSGRAGGARAACRAG
ncbi:hypothetical protein G6F62_014917 [Rhizopus arrhizus]|nr:hypothetical protein G6F62_014917 [Rhizopus arrhizus]